MTTNDDAGGWSNPGRAARLLENEARMKRLAEENERRRRYELIKRSADDFAHKSAHDGPFAIIDARLAGLESAVAELRRLIAPGAL